MFLHCRAGQWCCSAETSLVFRWIHPGCPVPSSLSTPVKPPAVALCPGTLPRSLWDMLEYLSPSQCRKQWEFSRNRTQQEARGAAHLQRVQLGENKEGKVLGAVPGFHRPPWLSKQRESSPRKELWQRGGAGLGSVTVPSASQRLCPVAAGPGAGGTDGAVRGPARGDQFGMSPPGNTPWTPVIHRAVSFSFCLPLPNASPREARMR